MAAATTLTDARTTQAWHLAETFCKRHFGCTVEELGWEQLVERAVIAGEDTESECRRLGEMYDLEDLTASPWGLHRV